jgi:hypothetical protein
MMFQVGEWPEICLRGVIKCYFVEVNEAMFKGVERTCEIILGRLKSDLDEFTEVIFQVGEWPSENIICLEIRL